MDALLEMKQRERETQDIATREMPRGDRLHVHAYPDHFRGADNDPTGTYDDLQRALKSFDDNSNPNFAPLTIFPKEKAEIQLSNFFAIGSAMDSSDLSQRQMNAHYIFAHGLSKEHCNKLNELWTEHQDGLKRARLETEHGEVPLFPVEPGAFYATETAFVNMHLVLKGFVDRIMTNPDISNKTLLIVADSCHSGAAAVAAKKATQKQNWNWNSDKNNKIVIQTVCSEDEEAIGGLYMTIWQAMQFESQRQQWINNFRTYRESNEKLERKDMWQTINLHTYNGKEWKEGSDGSNNEPMIQIHNFWFFADPNFFMFIAETSSIGNVLKPARPFILKDFDALQKNLVTAKVKDAKLKQVGEGKDRHGLGICLVEYKIKGMSRHFNYHWHQNNREGKAWSNYYDVFYKSKSKQWVEDEVEKMDRRNRMDPYKHGFNEETDHIIFEKCAEFIKNVLHVDLKNTDTNKWDMADTYFGLTRDMEMDDYIRKIKEQLAG